MHIQPSFRVADVHQARRLIRDHPFATLVTADLRATHMPVLVDEDAEGLAVLGHVARADPVAGSLASEEMLVIVHGPHGYISGSWYEQRTMGTWSYVILHLRGRPELLPHPMPVLERTVDHLERLVAEPYDLRTAPEEDRALAEQVVGFRMPARTWHLEAKLSQDKPAADQARIVDALTDPGTPYANPSLSGAMRDLGAPR